MRYQPIYDIAEICVRKGISEVVVCPGSRCAPLTLAFTRHPNITVRTFSDERSAGFIALGMAQSTDKPVVIVCTSGTAVYNLAPAVAEAYFSHTPLLVITADRPAEWIAQHDGQTIYQPEVFGKHVKKYFGLPQDYEHPDSVWAINRIVNDAVNTVIQQPCGPVHINAPFREPLYPASAESTITYTSDLRVMNQHLPETQLSPTSKELIAEQWPEFGKVLIVCGQHKADQNLVKSLQTFGNRHQVPIVHDIISNLHEVGGTIAHSDLFLGQVSDQHKEKLQPDLLITFGHSLISKNLKIFLRKYPARKHWHIQPQGPVADTFKTVTDVFFANPAKFIHSLTDLANTGTSSVASQAAYASEWRSHEGRVLAALKNFFAGREHSELSLVERLLNRLPVGARVHLANSMSVRYANFIGLIPGARDIRVFANRGTSGIDGSTSTAIGHTLTSGRPNFLITGDLAFFYDRNAFWHNYPLENFRVLLLNNHGGLIFDILEGPSAMPEAREYFITRQQLNAQKLCEEFGIQHLKFSEGRNIKEVLDDFFTFDNHAKVLELEGDTTSNKAIFETLKLHIKKSYEL
ncbi:MAG TPA: 2-succinyl-5-enolpyruvyl-6-hydroxy-3-cyclohexene-1-carboxylic-acid synthase [Chryseosolibacter sp.]|nr:2-succinyl-5-enolpyruvyl-6-hydroxy-3-cyclohexene-1-carboxylic-acid synthase [Chryseosolibacter sp.]